MPVTLEDLALGRVTPGSRLYCLHCGDEFKQVELRQQTVQGCMKCWRKHNYAGPPPADSAPVGAFAAQGIWDAAPPGERRGHSKDSMYKESARSSSKEQRRAGSKETRSGSKESRAGSKQSMGRRGAKEAFVSESEGGGGLPLTPDPPEKQGRKLRLAMPMPLWTMADWSPVPTPTNMQSKEASAQPRSLLPPATPEHPGAQSRGNAKEEPRRLLHMTGGQTASMPELRPNSRHHSNGNKLASLAAQTIHGAQGFFQQRPPPSQQSRRRRPVRSVTISEDVETGTLVSPAHKLAPLLVDEDHLPALALSGPGSPTHDATAALLSGVADEHVRSVIRKLSSKRSFSDAMTSIVAVVDPDKVSRGEGFRMLDGSGGFSISKVEMAKGLRRLGVTVPSLELDGVLRAFEVGTVGSSPLPEIPRLHGTGEIHIDEFADVVRVWSRLPMAAKHRPAGQDERADLPVLSKDGKEIVCGFEIGARVKTVVSIPSLREAREEGVVVGHGFTSGTVAVRFEASNATLSVKPGMISAGGRLLSAKRQQSQHSLPAFEGKALQ